LKIDKIIKLLLFLCIVDILYIYIYVNKLLLIINRNMIFIKYFLQSIMLHIIFYFLKENEKKKDRIK